MITSWRTRWTRSRSGDYFHNNQSTMFGSKRSTRFAFASRPWKIYSHVNSNPLAPTQRGASRCRTESAKAHPAIWPETTLSYCSEAKKLNSYQNRGKIQQRNITCHSTDNWNSIYVTFESSRWLCNRKEEEMAKLKQIRVNLWQMTRNKEQFFHSTK